MDQERAAIVERQRKLRDLRIERQRRIDAFSQTIATNDMFLAQKRMACYQSQPSYISDLATKIREATAQLKTVG